MQRNDADYHDLEPNEDGSEWVADGEKDMLPNMSLMLVMSKGRKETKKAYDSDFKALFPKKWIYQQ